MEEKNNTTVDMSENDGEFMLEPVPMSARRSTRSQFMVWIGFGYAVTGLIIGGTLGGYGGTGGMPPSQAMMAIILGMGALYLVTCFLGIVAQKTGLNLSLLARFSYGYKGSAIPMAVMALLTLGWFSSILGMIGDICGAFIGNPTGVIVFDPSKYGFSGVAPITLEVVIACVFWGLVFTFTAVKGMGAIEKVSDVFAPLILIVAVVVGIIYVVQCGGVGGFLDKANELHGFGMGEAITAVVGSWIAGAVMGVDMFRFNKSTKAVWGCAAACFILTNPILNIVGYIGTVYIGNFNYVLWMLGVNFIVAILGVVVWTTALWTTDNSELYCNALYTGPSLNAFGINVSRKKLVIIAGVIGTVLGSFAFYQLFFANFINILGSMAPPLCAPILADYFVIGRKNKDKYNMELLNKHPNFRWAGVISFAVGAILGFVFQYKITLPLDLPSGLVAMVISFIVYIAIYKMTPDAAVDEKLVSGLEK